VGNYARALTEFENTISVKDDHAFAYYFASKCHEKLGNHEKAVEYDQRFNAIMEVSEFWQEWATEFNFNPEKLAFEKIEMTEGVNLACHGSLSEDTDPKMLGNSAGWGTI
jgi:tetratricopeptide (TPR) repeat protein